MKVNQLVKIITVSISFIICLSNTIAQTNPDGRFITSLTTDPNTAGIIYAGTYGTGIFYSSNYGESWTPINNNLSNTWVYSLAVSPTTSSSLFAGSWKGIYITTDNGVNWSKANTHKSKLITSIVLGGNGSGGNNIYAGWESGVFRSTDNGVQWNSNWQGMSNADVKALVVSPDSAGKLFAGTKHYDSTYFGSVYVSRNFGSDWTQTTLKYVSITCLAIRSGSLQILFAGTKGNGIYRSTDDGVNWTPVNNGLSNLIVHALAINPNIQGELYAATEDGIFRSINNGDNWNEINSGLANTNIHSLAIIPGSPEKVFAGTWGDGVYCTTNSGANWIEVNNGLQNENYRWNQLALPDTGNLYHYQRIYVDGSECWLLGARKIYHSYNYPEEPFEVIYENQNQYFALNDWVFRKDNDKKLAWAVGYSSLGARSTDTLGLNWTQMSLGGTSTYTCVTFPTNLIGYASGNDHRIHKTTNGGANWFDLNPGQPGPGFSTVNSLFYLSVDTGYVCTSDPRLAMTTDGGFNWEDVGDIANGVSDVFFSNSNHGWAVGYGYINCYHNGVWTNVESPVDVDLHAVYFTNENEGWVVGNNGVILHTKDGGFTWAGQYCGIDDWLMDVYFSSPANGYIVGYHGNIFHTTNGGASFIEDEQINFTLTQFLLEQNYPNPFNPSTIISYQLPVSSNVTLKVYDVLGNEVATVINEHKPAGNYEVNFNPASSIKNPASGIYFYQLKAGDYLETKKMVLVK